MRRSGRWFTGVLLVLAGSGCASAPPKCDQVLDVYLSASGDINPGPDGQPLPVKLRIYQLKDHVKFDAADFHTIWQEDTTTLGPEVLDKAELTLFPSSTETRHFWRKAQASYLALVAIFRNPNGNDWRLLLPLPDAAQVQKRCKEDPGKPVRTANHLAAKGSSLKNEPETAVAR